MFKHILVPLDGSKYSERAIPYALEIAAQEAKISLIYITEIPVTPFMISPSPPLLPQETESYEMYRIRQIERAETYLKETVTSLASKHQAKIETKLITGKDPAEHILAFTEQHAVDVIVMATHGYSGFTRWIMGSVTQKVLQASPCPVLVVPSRDLKKDSSTAKP
ncbi:universal stress protein [Anaerolineales bacterium]